MAYALRIFSSIGAVFLLAACGLKGPLYLPPPEGAESQTSKPVSQKETKPNKTQDYQSTPSSGADEQKAPTQPQTPSSSR